MRDRSLWPALAAVWALVLLRSGVFLVWEQAHVTSDQAIVGLMAHHIVEGRGYPLFFYGQSYLLAIEPYLVAPFLWLGGPTMTALRAGMIAINLATATLLVAGLVRWGGLRRRDAVIASLVFVLAPPFTTSLLVEAQGGNVEVLLFAVWLWGLRERPLWLGAVFGVAFFNREFIVFAVPVLVAADVVAHGRPGLRFARRWLLTLVACLAVWQATGALKPYADMMGPGSRGHLLEGAAGSSLNDVGQHMALSVASWPRRVVENVGRFLPALAGAATFRDVVADQGRDALRWPFLLGLVALAGRVAWLVAARRALDPRLRFPLYLAGVGAASLVGLALVWGLTDGTLRYALLGLWLPVGLIAAALGCEPAARVRQGITAAVLVWAGLSAVDHVALYRRYITGQVPDVYGDVARALVARGVTVARAPYWHAYRLTFLSGERVKIASTDVVRITEYQTLADAAGDRVLTIQETPCDHGGDPVGPLFLCGR